MTGPFTPAYIAELRALAEKATPGPWRQHLVDDTTVIDEAGNTVAQTFPDGGLDDDVDFATDTEQREHDAAFIATARTALPAALDEIERLRAENEKLREALKPFAIALDIARNALGEHADGGHVEAVAFQYVSIGDFCRARRALEGGAS